MNKICTLILAVSVSHNDLDEKRDNYIVNNKDIATTCVGIMNDVKFKLEQCFGINLETLDGHGQSNIILETNEDSTELDTTNITTVTGPEMVKSISSCATIIKNTNKQDYNDILKERNSSLNTKHKIQSYYHLNKKYCIFKVNIQMTIIQIKMTFSIHLVI